ncbi:MAG TPA: signal recognition particle-docking protein FtsY [Anaerolineae bacterium]|nr:signal recognition particle-docking protein FtsY [Anaerolineae bacterium]HOR00497.1 signal recognition particle-docking protein FtsY [Anaerolineae bacterium]HPL30297.1 signal recognition particle-docking protein FtsY [Anaerolineae bacterium]
MLFRRQQKQEQQKSIQESLSQTRRTFFGRLATTLLGHGDVDEAFWEALEESLILADVGMDVTLEVVGNVRQRAESRAVRKTDQVEEMLRQELLRILAENQRPYLEGVRSLSVVLVVGVNGSGKTTSIAKLARYHQTRGDRVLLGAADTFRAAAIDQLRIWGEHIGVDVVGHQQGSDPGAVAFDTIQAAQARGANVAIIDTAGRLHTKHNLMAELQKIRGVVSKQVHRAPHETLLVLDATTGQNAMAQAKAFCEAVAVTGVVLAKLDSSAKGGMAFSIAHELELPIYFAGTGERVDDFAEFDAEAFVAGLFEREA